MASKIEVQEEHQEGVLVLVPVGRIDSSNAPGFERLINNHIDDGETNIIVDFGRLSFISSSGMRVLLIAAKSVRGAPDGKLVLCGMRDSIREIFSISGFDAIIPVVSTRADAMNVK